VDLHLQIQQLGLPHGPEQTHPTVAAHRPQHTYTHWRDLQCPASAKHFYFSSSCVSRPYFFTSPVCPVCWLNNELIIIRPNWFVGNPDPNPTLFRVVSTFRDSHDLTLSRVIINMCEGEDWRPYATTTSWEFRWWREKKPLLHSFPSLCVQVKLWRLCEPEQEQPSSPELTLHPGQGRLELLHFHPTSSGLLAIGTTKCALIWDTSRHDAPLAGNCSWKKKSWN